MSADALLLALNHMAARFLGCICSLALAVGLHGCKSVPIVGDVVDMVSKPFTATESKPVVVTQPRPEDPITNFAATAAPGENAWLPDPATGREVEVQAGRTFDSAGGDKCRYLNLTETSGRRWREIACEADGGEWQRSKAVATTARRSGSSTPMRN